MHDGGCNMGGKLDVKLHLKVRSVQHKTLCNYYRICFPIHIVDSKVCSLVWVPLGTIPGEFLLSLTDTLDGDNFY